MSSQKILLTGATGYIGRRLLHVMMTQDEVSLRVLVRHADSLSLDEKSGIEVVEGSSFDTAALHEALKGVDVAYYLIHSLGCDDFATRDKISAANFIEAARACGVKKVIYLGGLGTKEEQTSLHLKSRIETGEVLMQGSDALDVIWFRAGVIIGSGSTSFEIIRNLIEKLPVMITPKWVRTMAQPIAVDDVIAYLDAAKERSITGSHTVDIGSQKLCYQSMMLDAAKVMGLKRYIIPVPFLSIGLSSYWLNLFTPVPFKVARALIEGLGSEVVVQNDHAKTLFKDITPMSYDAAVTSALKEVEEHQIISRWSDHGGDVWQDDHLYSIANAVFVDRQRIALKGKSPLAVFQSFCSIGGSVGWFGYDWLWELRGIIDKMFGGVGLNRGRRLPNRVRVGDSIDFWKVIAVEQETRLLLFAQMKVPGKAYLEFKIDNGYLVQSAYFLPKGVFGRLYWYALIPLHNLVFENMARNIVAKARER